MQNNITFVTYHEQGGQRQHARSRRACSECRHRKKRCHHQRSAAKGISPSSCNLVWKEQRTIDPADHRGSVPDKDPTPEEQPESALAQPLQDQSSLQELEEAQMQQAVRSESHENTPTPRFVGDLNPEARLLDKATSPQESQEMAPGEVGIWVQPKPCSMCGSSNEGHSNTRRRMQQSHAPVSDILSQKTVRTLSQIYFANLHPIIPLLNEDEYWLSLSHGTTPAPLVHVVCLLAAKDNASEKHLSFLQSTVTPVPVREFCSRLYESVSIALSRRTSLRKVTRMRILGLLSLHQEGTEGMEESSMCNAQAIHNAQSLALHLPRPNDPGNELKRIFWCLWTLDRLNAATNSRPCIMADIDIAIPEVTQEESGSVAFDVCFRIASILNTVIGFYRPKEKDPVSGWDLDFPEFELILDEMHAWQLPSSTIATLHIFYLATAILAHRLKTITTLPSPTPARIRQQLSATQIIRYMQDPVRLDGLHPFPIVVYATSLALSVSYQQLRYSRLSSDQEVAHHDFNTGCDILQKLRGKWASADVMASLAHRISTALDQLPSLDMLRADRPKSIERQENPIEGQEIRTSTTEGNIEPSGYQPLVHHPPELPGTEPYETMDLLSSMDNISWMFLDAENPINFDNFPLANLNESYAP